MTSAQNTPKNTPQAQDAPDATDAHWIAKATDEVFSTFGDRDIYNCASGHSPSGTIHFGNFRDIITSYAIACELRARGKKARLFLSWDNYDRFRKVPAGVDPSFAKYIGFPLTKIPDPWGEFASYAERYEKAYEASMRDLSIDIEYRYQTDKYTHGDYCDLIIQAMQQRKRIAEIQLSFKSEKGNEKKGITPEEYIKSYFPITLYSRFSGSDKTEILAYDGGTKVTYRCITTDKTETIDFKEIPIVKLQWKVDWAMRWLYEDVHFEPSGLDHDTPGGARDVSTVIAKEIYNRTAPVRLCYQFVGLQGLKGKMSGSSGLAVSPETLMHFYEPEILKWLYLRRSPAKSFHLSFDTEVYRQYDEFDREVLAWQRGENGPSNLSFCGIKKGKSLPPLPFKQAVALGQITQWNFDKFRELADISGLVYDPESLTRRLPRARAWLEEYNADEIIKLRDAPHTEYYNTLDNDAKTRIAALHDLLTTTVSTIAELEEKVYAIPKKPEFTEKEMKVAQRAFFKDVYTLLISRDTGPRLSTFLWAIDRKRTLTLLEFKNG